MPVEPVGRYCPGWIGATGQEGATFHRLPNEMIGCRKRPALDCEQSRDAIAPRELFIAMVTSPKGCGRAASRTAALLVGPSSG
jgi:hypothetical protein